jgi:hypothetical protein
MVDGERVAGTATWEHDILYDEETVRKPLREMFRHPGKAHDDRTLLRFRIAIHVVYHENLHLLAARGTEHADARTAYRDPAVKALDEGATEEYSHETLDDFIDEVQLETIAPGLKTVRSSKVYARFTPAAATLADELGVVARSQRLEVLRRMVIVNAADKWSVATGILAKAYGLTDLLPADRLAEVEAQLKLAMWRKFDELPTLAPLPANELFGRSVNVGKQAFEIGLQAAGLASIQGRSIGGLPRLVPGRPDRGNGGWSSRPATSSGRQSSPER